MFRTSNGATSIERDEWVEETRKQMLKEQGYGYYLVHVAVDGTEHGVSPLYPHYASVDLLCTDEDEDGYRENQARLEPRVVHWDQE